MGWPNIFGCGCCDGSGPPPTSCDVTFHVIDVATGDPVSGVSVQITGWATGPATTTGTTDGSGDYTVTIPAGASLHYKTGFGVGCPIPSGPGTLLTMSDCPVINLCYCGATIRVNISPAGDFTADGSSVNEIPGYHQDPGDPGLYRYCQIVPCEQPYLIRVPAARIIAYAEGYVNACESVAPACGDDLTLDFSLFRFSPCYLASANDGDYPGDGDYTGACIAHRYPCTNPSVADGAGLTPRSLQVRFGTIADAHSHGCTRFADDEGVWIDVGIVENTFNHSCTGKITYSSGCRGGAGNFFSYSFPNGPDGGLNCVNPYETHRAFYGSTMVTILAPDPRFSGIGSVTYRRFTGPACVDDAPVTTFSAPEFPVTVDQAFFDMKDLQAICDFGVNGTGSFSAATHYAVEIREAPC